MWSGHREEAQQRKEANARNSIRILTEKGVRFRKMPGAMHYRVGDFDFWPSTGLFYNAKTKRKGRGVFNLLSEIGPRSLRPDLIIHDEVHKM